MTDRKAKDQILEIIQKKQDLKVQAAKLRLESAKLSDELAKLAATGVAMEQFGDLARCW